MITGHYDPPPSPRALSHWIRAGGGIVSVCPTLQRGGGDSARDEKKRVGEVSFSGRGAASVAVVVFVVVDVIVVFRTNVLCRCAYKLSSVVAIDTVAVVEAVDFVAIFFILYVPVAVHTQ